MKEDLIRVCTELSEELSTYDKENEDVNMLMGATLTDILDLIATIKAVNTMKMKSFSQIVNEIKHMPLETDTNFASGEEFEEWLKTKKEN